MTLPKLSAALTLLLTTANASASSETNQEWYVASQARGLLHRILQQETAMYHQNSNEETSSSVSSSGVERHLSYKNLNSARKQRSFNKLQNRQPPNPIDVLNSLNQYDKFWIEIKPESSSCSSSSSSSSSTATTRRNGSSSTTNTRRNGPCVWSECGLDNVDDEYTGDNRDGDSQWYQFRTQDFCANAAYSLYGRKKGDVWGKFGECTQRHFINSFFTYGGSDNLLKAVNNGKSPQVYYGNYGAYSNADCVAGYNGGYSTLGCSASGEFLIGNFGGNSCDGNYFQDGKSEAFSSYNSNFREVKCHGMDVETDKSSLYTLLQGSWACDVRTFGDSCPDPYQRKGYYEYALQTAQAGGNPIRAYNHLMWKDELRLFSWVLLAVSLLLFFAAFSIKQCAIKKQPAGSLAASTFDEELSPTASAMTAGSFRFELEDGGKLKNIMEDVSAKTLAGAAWFQWKIGRGNKPEAERTFQSGESSPEKKDADEGYKSPPASENEPVGIQLTRSTTPSQARLGLTVCDTNESALEMAPQSSLEAKTVEDKPWVTMNKKPRQSLQ
eukprot:CAMPEP_0201718490 /NCGR_PEP_ID=MMETSP0593-20130828/3992_1 /ASSEMBLY_ACC=CAM_ASM_000672 /TAXON_ID=267983 /ORGANISM="Skeletonema japonicum, Strain CCMP2506" /LENGTH=553 /DNA_ID=CAMNT_0048208801 /DNA_START=147 /DNA_END=1808 /DNA_ORIENTATION=-